MLQNSSVGTGHSFENFTRLHGRLETAMDIIVEQHYTSFNDAVSIFGDIILNVKRSSEIVGDVHREIAEFRDHVQYKRGAELPAMLSAVKEFKGRIAATRKLDKIKVQITEARRLWERRFFVPAARSLMDCLYDARYLRQTILEDSLINSIYETSRVIDNERDVSITY